MAGFVTTWQMVVKRMRAHWRLLSAVLVGVVLAVAIMSSTVIYYDALRNLALTHILLQYKTEDTNLLIRGDHGPTNNTEYIKVTRFVTRQIDQKTKWLLRGQEHGGKSATFFLAQPGEQLIRENSRDRAFFQFTDNLDKHIRLVQGRLPSDVVVSQDASLPEFEVAIDSKTANLFGVNVGSRLSTLPYWSDVNSRATVIITGIVEPTDADEEFWQLGEKAFQSTSSSFRFAPLYVTKKTFFEGVGIVFPRMTSTYAWLLEVDTSRITGDTASKAKRSIDSFGDELGSMLTSYSQASVLSKTLGDYEKRIFFAKVPMFIVLILIAAVILYYVVALSSMLVEEHRGEVALLRSRGASSFQILLVFVLEGFLVSALAVGIGPLIASVTIGFLGITPAFTDLSGGHFLLASLSKEAFYMSMIGGLLGFLALVIPAIQASRIGVIQHKQHASRPPSQPVFHRYYLDLVLLLIAILLFRELSQQGSVLATKLFGEVVVNKLLLALPAIILLATAMILLRLFPLVMRVVSYLLASRVPAGLAIGIWQMARSPTHYARLSLLLILTAGLGIFAASFGGTLERSFKERALYSTGSDIRLTDVAPNSNASSLSLKDAYKNIPGVSQTGRAFRSDGLVLSGFSTVDYTMFAMEPEIFAAIAWFRDDFAGKPVKELIQGLPAAQPLEGIALPSGSRDIGVWVRPDQPYPDVTIQARVYDSNGRFFTYSLGNLGFVDWRLLNVSLIRVSRGQQVSLQPVEPLYLVSLSVIKLDGQTNLMPGSVVLGSILARQSNGNVLELENFSDSEKWKTLKVGARSSSDSLLPLEHGGQDGSSAAVFLWSAGGPFQPRGIYMGPLVSYVPAIASKDFLKESRRSLGDVMEVSVSGNRVPVKLVSTIDFFPTLDPYKQNFLVADLDSLLNYINVSATFSEIQPNEFWLSSSTQGSERTALVSALRKQPFSTSQIQDRQTELAKLRVDPLVAAGWRALLFVAFSAVLLLSAIGYLVHAYISFRNRRLEFAMLRTMGLSLGQLVSLIWLEHILVIGLGMALGTWMGGRLGTIIMPFLGNTEGGNRVLPPYVLEVNWTALATTYAIIAVLFTLTIIGVIWFIHRLPLQRVLRMGEM